MGRRIYTIDYRNPVWKLGTFEYKIIKQLSAYKATSRKFRNDFDGDIWILDDEKIEKGYPKITKLVEKMADQTKDDDEDKIWKLVFRHYNKFQDEVLKKEPAKKREYRADEGGGKVTWYEMPAKWKQLDAELFVAELYILAKYGSGIIYVEI